MGKIMKGVVNLVLNGFSGWGSETAEAILGVPVASADLEAVRRLSRSQVLQLFHAAEAPVFSEMRGEYKAEVLPLGPFKAVADFYTHNLFGPGRWQGKAFYPLLENAGWGYNIFDAGKRKKVNWQARTCRMNTYLGPSNMDDKMSFHLDYRPWNGFLNATMHDELRKINDHLFLGMGYMGAGGGPVNPAPFLVYDTPAPWVGPDTV